jgi:SAM-dependent methyltransferase
MCHPSCIEFGRANLAEQEIRGRSVIEVGALDINGSLRPLVEELGPSAYLGVDVIGGRGVDEICPAGELVGRFGAESFDVLISTELLEHVRDWREAVRNFKHVLRPGGLLLITTRSKGCGYHGYPFDFWRFEASDLSLIFPEFRILVLESDPDPVRPGVFLKAEKPAEFAEADISEISLYSILKGRRVRSISDADMAWGAVRHWAPYNLRLAAGRMLPRPVKDTIKRLLSQS